MIVYRVASGKAWSKNTHAQVTSRHDKARQPSLATAETSLCNARLQSISGARHSLDPWPGQSSRSKGLPVVLPVVEVP